MSDTSQQKRPIFDVPEQGIAIQRITPVEQDLACSVPTKERSEMRKGEGIVAGVMPSALARSWFSRNFRAGLLVQKGPKHRMPEMFYG